MAVPPSRDRPLIVLVAGRNDVSRAGLKAILTEDSRFSVRGETASDVVALAQRLDPDLIVLDPEVSGHLDLPCIAELVARMPNGHVCLCTTLVKPQEFLDAMRAGARAYLHKASSGAIIRDALAVVGHCGATVIDQAVAEHFGDRAAARLVLHPVTAGGQLFSRREWEVLALLADGATDKEITAQLGIRASTVQTYVQHICTKLGASRVLKKGRFVGHRATDRECAGW